MKLSSNAFADNQRIPFEYAFCAPDPMSHVTLSRNRNPQLGWSEAPAGTRSLVLTCHDYDVPKCGVTGIFKGPDVLAAIKGRTLAQAKLTAVYSLNPDVKV